MQKRFLQQMQAQLRLTGAQPIGLMGAGLVLSGATIAVSASIAQASSLQWQYDPDSAALSVNLPSGTTPRYFLAAQPARIVVDLPNTDIGTVQTEKQFPGAVQQIRVAQFQPGITRIVMQLAPGTVLAPQQVSLQQSGNQWVLRPVLADANPAPTQTIAAAHPPAANIVPAAPNSTPIAPDNSIAANPTTPEPPPLEPGATEIPVELPPADLAATAAPTVSVPALPSSAANPTIAAPAVPEPPAPPAEVQPTETAADPQPVQPNEPSIGPTASLPAELPPASADALPTELPPATIAPAGETTVNVPALDPPSRPPSAQQQSRSPARSRDVAAIEFGQPLPGTASMPTGASPRQPAPSTEIAAASAPGVLLPAGTVLNLRYEGEETLRLASDYPLQEVLVVDREVRNQAGQIIVPAGSHVIGRFETGSSGSEFIAQAISIDGQNFLLNGRSDKLSGDREVSGNQMMVNSAIGAVAGTLLGAVTGVGFIAGILAGAGTSAATTYLTAPQPAVIEPDRIVEVRLLEDLRQPGFGIGG